MRVKDIRQGPDKARVFEEWRGRARHWDAWADRMAKMSDRFNQPLIEETGIRLGDKVLDLASGTGEPALSIARTVGPEGRVTATDLVPDMLESGARRAREAALDNIVFEVADMESLPFADGEFDRVTCRFGLMFVPDPVRALAQAHRVLAAGGTAGFMVWGPFDDTTNFFVLRQAFLDLFPDEAPDFEIPFRLGAEGALKALFAEAGFAEAEERELRFAPEIPATVKFWRPNVAMTLGHRLENEPDSVRAALEERIVARLEPYRERDVYRLAAHIRIGIGRRPA
jgi:SAM-dependent methyltransferase